MRRWLLILLCLTFFAACEVAPLYLSEESEQQIVVNCLFKPGDFFMAQLSETHFRTRPSRDTLSALSDAEVRLFEDGELIGQFVENDTLYSHRQGIYTLDHYPVLGKIYRIEVTKEGYESVWAESRVPPVRGTVDVLEISRFTRSFGGVFYDVSVSLNDTPGDDYYHIDIYEETWDIDFLTGDTIDTWFVEGWPKVNHEFIVQRSGDWRREELIFEDVLFDGTSLQIEFRDLVGMGRGYPEGTDFGNLPEDTYVTYYLYVKNVTFEYYEYFRTGMQQLETNEDPFAEPVRIYSNVNHGKGVFAGYNEKIYVVPLGFLYYEGD